MLKFPPLTPETLIMLPLAIAIDLVSWILLCFALDDFGMLDIIGTIFIGTWLFFRKGKPVKGKKDFLTEIFTGKNTKFLVPIGTEIIPYVGAICPTWTLSVYFNLIE